MDLYLIGVAEATPKRGGGPLEDAKRPLTEKGREQARQLAESLQRRGLRVEMIVTSPLLRAQQTAKGVQENWKAPAPNLRINEELAPGTRPRRLTRVLADLRLKNVALVGHRADLARYAGWLIGDKEVRLRVPKAGVAHIAFPEEPRKGTGVLVGLLPLEWLTPGQATAK